MGGLWCRLRSSNVLVLLSVARLENSDFLLKSSDLRPKCICTLFRGFDHRIFCADHVLQVLETGVLRAK